MRGKAEVGRAKYITISSSEIDGVYVAIRQKVGLVKIWGAGVFSTEDKTKHKKRVDESYIFNHAIRSSGMCLSNGCGVIDFSMLDEHHVFGKAEDDFSITLCANHHRELHWYLGGNRRINE